MCSCFAIWLPEPKTLKINVTDQLIIIKLVYTAKIMYKPLLYKNKNFCPAKVNFGPLWKGRKILNAIFKISVYKFRYYSINVFYHNILNFGAT